MSVLNSQALDVKCKMQEGDRKREHPSTQTSMSEAESPVIIKQDKNKIKKNQEAYLEEIKKVITENILSYKNS